MTEEENDEKQQPTKAQSPGIRRVLIIASAAMAMLLAVASGFYITQLLRAPKKTPDKSTAYKAQQKVVYFKLKEFTVNLSSDGQYLETEMVLQLSNEVVKKEIDNKMPQIRDELISILMSKSGSTLISAQGKSLLKQDIITKLNSILTSGKVSTIHFASFLMQ